MGEIYIRIIQSSEKKFQIPHRGKIVRLTLYKFYKFIHTNCVGRSAVVLGTTGVKGLTHVQ